MEIEQTGAARWKLTANRSVRAAAKRCLSMSGPLVVSSGTFRVFA
jgi:hypothetical protein